MKDLYNSFQSDKKPEWLTMTEILEYEKKWYKYKVNQNGNKKIQTHSFIKSYL